MTVSELIQKLSGLAPGATVVAQYDGGVCEVTHVDKEMDVVVVHYEDLIIKEVRDFSDTRETNP